MTTTSVEDDLCCSTIRAFKNNIIPTNNPENITFGILTDYVAEYHRQVIRGIQTTLEQTGVNSVVFVGTDLSGENLPKPVTAYFVGGNATYDLVSSRLNGLIALVLPNTCLNASNAT